MSSPPAKRVVRLNVWDSGSLLSALSVITVRTVTLDLITEEAFDVDAALILYGVGSSVSRALDCGSKGREGRTRPTPQLF